MRWQMVRKTKHRYENEIAIKLEGKRKATNNIIARESKDRKLESCKTQMGSTNTFHKFWNFHKKVNRKVTSLLII